ncbi:hypothetical protein A54_43 [Septuagintavirus sv54]|uniref:Uncharacterized protein n=1 Tax=Escherichia phage A5-4 TaxID=2996162 RepID=A0AAE9PQZ6_9CAUD|nr:hypothetical protein A54_43 [Escherichia phage A5-4]
MGTDFENNLCPLEKFFGRDVYKVDREAISKHGMPKFASDTVVRVNNPTVKFENKTYSVKGIVYSDHFNTWVYEILQGFYIVESELEEI